MTIKTFLTTPETRLPLFLLAGLSILAFWLYGELGRAYRGALEAATSANASQEFSSRIIDLKKRPELVADRMSTTAQIAQSVELAMQEAAITGEKLVRIEPRAAIRFEKTPFLLQPSHIELREISLEQLIRFLYLLSTRNHLEATDLRLHAPRTATNETAPELWNAELVLTNTLYFP